MAEKQAHTQRVSLGSEQCLGGMDPCSVEVASGCGGQWPVINPDLTNAFPVFTAVCRQGPEDSRLVKQFWLHCNCTKP